MKAIGKRGRLPAIRVFAFTLAAFGAFATAAFPASAGAQRRLASAASGRTKPAGSVVVAIRAGTAVRVVSNRGANALVTVDGWVESKRLAARVDTFAASTGRTGSLPVLASASANAPVLAEFQPGAGVATIERSGAWTHVRRSAWIPASALAKAPVPAAVPSASVAPVAPAPPVAVDAPPGAMSVPKPTRLLAAPSGAAVAELPAGTVVQTLARDHGWAKVMVEGWVSESQLAPAAGSAAAALTAADLHADPDGTRGRVVQWEVEILAFQTADPLRKEMAPDEPYLLAKGPGTEDALLYLAIPPALLAQAKAIAPLTHVLITARVRSGRSEPVGVSILDLTAIAKR